MPPSAEMVEQRTALIRDMLSDNEAIRDELNDEDSVTFMDWGRAQAAHVAVRLPDGIDDEMVYEAGGVLSRLMSTMKRIIIRRGEKDAEWITRKFERLNELSQELWGEAAPIVGEEAAAAWIAGHAARSNRDLLHDLMAQYAPPAPASDIAAPPAPTAPPPLSASVDLHNLDLPGRTASPTGENDEQE
jgi:hypothetical protein